MTSKYDAIIIGAGNNGLTCGCYLAKAGLKVLILERSHFVGGAAITQEIVPGFRFSVFSYLASMLHPKVVSDLDLQRFGLRSFDTAGEILRPIDGKRYCMVSHDDAMTQKEIAKFSKKDAARYPNFMQHLNEIGAIFSNLRLETPVDITAKDFRSLKSSAALLWKYRNIGAGFYKLIDIFTLSSEEYLSRWFESSEVKAGFAFVAGGNLMGPNTRGSAWAALFGRLMVNDVKVIKNQIVGGMGAVTDAMQQCAEAHGATIETNSAVMKITTANGRVGSVVTEDGREYNAKIVVGNLHAKILYGKLIGAEHLPSEFMAEIRQFRSKGSAFKLNIACEKAPNFASFDPIATGLDFAPTTHIAPNMEYLNKCYEEANGGWYASRPWMIATVPTHLEPSLADNGKHIVQIYGGHIPYELTNGSWEQERGNFTRTVLDTIDEFAPSFSSGVIDVQLLLPQDIERQLNLPGGHINHGDMTLDQMFFKRPAAHYSDYRSPIKGLYQCGSSAHPGGGVTGTVGHNASREVLRDLRKRAH